MKSGFPWQPLTRAAQMPWIKGNAGADEPHGILKGFMIVKDFGVMKIY